MIVSQVFCLCGGGWVGMGVTQYIPREYDLDPHPIPPPLSGCAFYSPREKYAIKHLAHMNSIEMNGYPRIICGFPWTNHGLPRDIHGLSMSICGETMKIHGLSLDLHCLFRDHLWIPLDCPGMHR